MHIESSKLTVAEFARLVLAHGTTAIVSDPHEIANVLGTDGVHWLLDVCEGVPLDVYVMAPSCVPASPFESPRRPFTLGDMESILRRRRALGVAEMMNFPAVIAGDAPELAKRALADARRRPRARRDAAASSTRTRRPASAPTTRRSPRGGAREAAARLLGADPRGVERPQPRDLLPLVREYGPDERAFCTDDREPDFLVREGHMDSMCRVAVAHGIAPEDALLLASTRARCHGLDDRGAIAPGYRADRAAPRPRLVRVERVWKDGREVVERRRGADSRASRCRSGCARPCTPRRSAGRPARAVARPDVRVIEIVPGQLITHAREMAPTVRDGASSPIRRATWPRSPSMERHHATGRVGLGFVRASGCSAARSPPRSRTTRTTSSASASGRGHGARACAAWPRSAAASWRRGRRDPRRAALPVAGLLGDDPAARWCRRSTLLVHELARDGRRTSRPRS